LASAAIAGPVGAAERIDPPRDLAERAVVHGRHQEDAGPGVPDAGTAGLERVTVLLGQPQERTQRAAGGLLLG
jgi:hypothetical protein